MEFKILGPLEVWQNGRPLPCKSAKQRLLLAALLVRPNEVVSSDRLIQALWGERPPATAAKALQMHVSQLRRLLDPDVLLTRPPGYELRLDPRRLDLDRFEATVSEAKAAGADGRTAEAARLLAEALALWHGPPFADLSFEEYLQPEIARLQELRLTTLEDRIDADLALGRHADLIAELESLATEHALRERIRGQLMLALYRTGRQAEALEVYRDTRRALVEELGIEPTRELKALEQRILEQDPALDLQATSASTIEDLYGRERELAALLPTVDAALGGRPGVVLIGGEPGIGKSRLAEALARHAARNGARVGVGRCWEAGGAPAYWPWAQALRALGDPAVRDLFEAADDDAVGARFRMFEAAADFLRRAAPVAVFLDDLHAADAESLLLLRFVARELASGAVLVVGCFRDAGIPPDLDEALAELAHERSVQRITLGGLSPEAIAALLEAAIGEPPSADLAARVHAETRGNPLFATEVGRLLRSTDAAARQAERLPIPDSVRDAIRERVRGLSDRSQSVLGLASVFGREFDLAALATVSGADSDDLAGPIEEATAARLVEVVPQEADRMRFSHILVRDVLYEDLGATRRPVLHKSAGDALERLGASTGPHLAEIAHHYLNAGRAASDQAIRYATLAGDDAAARHGYEEAAHQYRTALELLAAQPADRDLETCELLLALGETLSRGGSTNEAKDALREAARIAADRQWPERMTRAALAYGGRFAWARSSTDPALVPLLEQAVELVGEGDLQSRARLLARLAAALRDDRSSDRRSELAEEAVRLAEASGDPVTLGYALEGYGLAIDRPERIPEGVELGERLIAIGRQTGDDERVFMGRDFQLHALWMLADRAALGPVVEAQLKLAEEMRQPPHSWHIGTVRAMLALMEGRFRDAEQLIDETHVIGENAEQWNAAVSQRLQLFVLRRAQGRLVELEPVIARSVREYPTLLRFECALVHLHAEVGRDNDARAGLRELLDRDLAHEHTDGEWLFSLSLLADACARLEDQEGAAILYELLEPHHERYAEAPAEASFGAIARCLGVLATALGRFADAQRHLETAIGIERRMLARPWIAHAQHDLAALWIARGDCEHAATLLAEAAAAYDALGMVTWAERARRLGQAPGLGGE